MCAVSSSQMNECSVQSVVCAALCVVLAGQGQTNNGQGRQSAGPHTSPKRARISALSIRRVLLVLHPPLVVVVVLLLLHRP